MILKSIYIQIKYILNRKEAIVTWFGLLCFVAWNFIANIVRNKDIVYVTQMYDPIKTLTLSTWSVSGFFLMSFYPLLVVLPTATAYLRDKNSGEMLYLGARLGTEKYMVGKFLAVCASTFIIFTLPFFMELVLDYICYSKASIGDPSNFEYLQTVENVKKYFAYYIFVKHKYVYAILCTLIFGVSSAVLAGFNYAVSTISFFKYGIFTFFPIYILLFIIKFLSNVFNFNFTTNYFFILRMFDIKEKNGLVYLLFMITLFILSFVIVDVNGRRKMMQ